MFLILDLYAFNNSFSEVPIGHHRLQSRVGFRTGSQTVLEARGGIEPPIRVLQTPALPLGDRASILLERKPGRLDRA